LLKVLGVIENAFAAGGCPATPAAGAVLPKWLRYTEALSP
jgi:hypothetical protein